MFDKSAEANAIANYAEERGISRLVHFTPFLNLLGVFSLGGIMARDRVVEYAQKHQDEDLMAFITWNDKLRLDRRTDCINISVQRINAPLFSRFKANFRQGEPWCIIEIDPVCMQKKGVLFTVANAAASAVRRNGTSAGLKGLQAMFGASISVRKSYGVEVCRRTPEMPKSFPTSVQAEVLYPGAIPIEYVKGLVFENPEGAARARAMLKMEVPGINLPAIRVCPEDFAA